jgi:hypothetical protein
MAAAFSFRNFLAITPVSHNQYVSMLVEQQQCHSHLILACVFFAPCLAEFYSSYIPGLPEFLFSWVFGAHVLLLVRILKLDVPGFLPHVSSIILSISNFIYHPCEPAKSSQLLMSVSYATPASLLNQSTC